MAKKFNDLIWIAIDIGTTKICVIVSRGLTPEQAEVLGVGQAPSDGLRRGVVVDIAKTVQSIRAAIAEAQLMSGISIESAVIGISGAHIHSRNSVGAVPILRGEVRPADITNVINAAQAVSIAQGQQILHVLPQFYIVDDEYNIVDPLGMSGVRLEVQVHIISGSVASVQNLIKCCQMAGVTVTDIVLEPLGSAAAVLSYDERELGVGILDIGGGTSDFAIYRQGTIRHTKIIPIAGQLLTNDLAIGLGATLKDAERVKREHGIVHLSSLHDDLSIGVEMVHGDQNRDIYALDIIRILQPRAQEIIEFVAQEIDRYQLRSNMRAGLVLTGGSALLQGLPMLAKELLNIPVRVGVPKASSDLPEVLKHPRYATSYGLILYEIQKRKDLNILKDGQGPLAKQLFTRMKSWVADFF